MAALVLTALLVLPAWARSAAALQVPAQPLGRVSDYAEVLTADQRAALEARLERYEQTARTSAEPPTQGRAPARAPQVAVVILPSLGGDPVEDVALRVAERWKIGSKADDGVLLLVAVAERTIRIEVGYGAEGRLPDALCSRIIHDRVTPRLREGDYAGGLNAGVAAIHQALSGQAVTEPQPPVEPSMPEWGPRQKILFWGVGGLVLLLLVLGLFTRSGREVEGFLFGMLFQSLFGGRGSNGGSGFSGGGGRFGGGGASGKY